MKKSICEGQTVGTRTHTFSTGTNDDRIQNDAVVHSRTESFSDLKSNWITSTRQKLRLHFTRAALDVRRAFLPAVVSTSGRIHGDLLRLLYLLADNKTKRHFRDRHEAIDDDSEAYCWRRSGFYWRMQASLGLACAQATGMFITVSRISRTRR